MRLLFAAMVPFTLLASLTAQQAGTAPHTHTRAQQRPDDSGPPIANETQLFHFGNHGGQISNTPPVQAWNGNFYASDTGFSAGFVNGIDEFTEQPNSLVPLVNLGGNNGNSGQAPIVQGPDGNLYIVNATSGANYVGSIFRVTPAGAPTDLYDFTNSYDGAYPLTLIVGQDGNLYGATDGSDDGHGNGSIFEYNLAANKFKFLTAICPEGNPCATTGAGPSGFVQATDGTFWGVNAYGGNGAGNGGLGYGTLIQFSTTTNSITTAYAFQGTATDGANPVSAPVFGSDGNLYLVVTAGGANGTGGLAQFNPATNAEQIVYSFSSASTSSVNFLSVGSDGNIYFTDFYGGQNNAGEFLFYDIAQSTAYVLYTAAATNDVYGMIGFAQAADGTFLGGGDGPNAGDIQNGVLAQMTVSSGPAGPVQVSLPTTAYAGGPVTITAAVTNAFSGTAQQCYAFAADSNTGNMAALGQLTGTLSSGVWTGSVSVTPAYAGSYHVAVTCGGISSGYGSISVAPSTPVQLTTVIPSPLVSGSTVQVVSSVTVNNAGLNQGAVTAYCQGVKVGTASIQNGSADLSADLAGISGTYECTFVYQDPTGKYGSATYGPVSITVTPQATTAALSVGSSPVAEGAPEQLTATISGAVSTPVAGTVTFYGSTQNSLAGARQLTSASVGSNGTASVTVAADASPGAYYVFAVYSGTSTSAGSQSSGQKIVVTAGDKLSKR